MEKSFLIKFTFYLGFLFFFSFPLLHILTYTPLEWVSWDPYAWNSFVGAFFQATLSSFVTMSLSFLGALGYLSTLRQRPAWVRNLFTFFILGPSFTPPLIAVLLIYNFFGPLTPGLGSLIFFHTLTNVGLAGLILAHLISEKAQLWAPLCRVEGVGAFYFIFRGLLPGLASDLRVVFFYLFILYFLSFSFPLLVGGGDFSGLEVFIYEKIFLFGQWTQALQYSFLLIGFLFFLFFSIRSESFWEKKSVYNSNSDHYGSPWLLGFLLWPCCFLCLGFLQFTHFQIEDFFTYKPDIQRTVWMGLSTGWSLLTLFSALAYCYPTAQTLRGLFFFITPSGVVLGFSLFLMGDLVNWMSPWGQSLLKVTWALTLIYGPYLYRLFYFSKLSQLRKQVQWAQVMGVGWNRIFFLVLWPQLLPHICFLSGLGALWACGDFALSSMLVEGNLSLTLKIQSLFKSYRLQEALNLLWPLIFSCGIVYSVFQGLAYVCYRSFSPKA